MVSIYLTWAIVLTIALQTSILTNLEAAIAVTVNSSLDYPAKEPAVSPDSTLGPGIVTLRSAIEYVNDYPQWVYGDTIAFNIPGEGVHRIQPGGPDSPKEVRGKELPAFQKNVDLDAYTQPGSQMNTLLVGCNAKPLIEINGSNYTVGDGFSTGNGLTFDGVTPFNGTVNGGSRVRGFIINEWSLAGINVLYESGSGINYFQISDIPFRIVGNFIGTNAEGNEVLANQIGIYSTALNCCIGTSSANAEPSVADRNIIAGNFKSQSNLSACIQLEGERIVIKNNYIGTNKSGTKALGNSEVGIRTGQTATIIGGTRDTERNVISGLSVAGIELISGAHDCIVTGNYIGLDATGTKCLSDQTGNGIVFAGGVWFKSVTNNTIGGSEEGAGNVISGWENGIVIGQMDFRNGINLNKVTNNFIQGNLIGTNAARTKAIPNITGIIVKDNSNTIGGSNNNEGNFIGGNRKYGIVLESSTRNNIVRHNTFGKGKLANGKENIHDLSDGNNIIKQNH